MDKQSKKVELGVIQHASLENNRAYLLRTEITKSHLNNRICQHCGVKTTTVTPSFYYVFNISLYCNISIPSFIANLWWVLLLGNHLNCETGNFSGYQRNKWYINDNYWPQRNEKDCVLCMFPDNSNDFSVVDHLPILTSGRIGPLNIQNVDLSLPECWTSWYS